MRIRLFLLPAVCCILFAPLTVPSSPGDTITFDDFNFALPSLHYTTNIPNGYHGLEWSNFFALSPYVIGYLSNGYYYGMVSPSNVAFNAGGNPAEIDSTGANFDFLSAYLTGAFDSNLNVQVEGFRGGSLIYNMTVQAAATNATLFTFDYLDIDRLYFNSFGGQPAFGGTDAEQFVMDNFMFEFIPEPSTFLLAALAAVSLAAVLRRERR